MRSRFESKTKLCLCVILQRNCFMELQKKTIYQLIWGAALRKFMKLMKYWWSQGTWRLVPFWCGDAISSERWKTWTIIASIIGVELCHNFLGSGKIERIVQLVIATILDNWIVVERFLMQKCSNTVIHPFTWFRVILDWFVLNCHFECKLCFFFWQKLHGRRLWLIKGGHNY